MKFNLFLFFLFMTSSGCATLQSAPQDTIISFETISTLPLGASKDLVSNKLGKPSEISEQTWEQPNEEWTYLSNDSIRVMLEFDSKSDALITKYWQVLETDPEMNIAKALQRFPKAKFKKQDAKIENPHFVSDETTYEDPKLGVFIVTQRIRNETVSISWTAPKR